MAAPSSPNLMLFDDDESATPLPLMPASISSVDTINSRVSPPHSPVTVPLPRAEGERKALHFFVSCQNIEGNSLTLSTRSAQTLVRGALSRLSSAANLNSTKSPREKPPTEVNVEVRVFEETPISKLRSEFQIPVIPVLTATSGHFSRRNSVAFETDHSGNGRTEKRPPLSMDDGLLSPLSPTEQESYWSERRKSRNPRFSVGFCITCEDVAERDRQVQIRVMIPDEGTSSNRHSHVFGYALTSFQEMYRVARGGNLKQTVTLPVHSHVLEGATVTLQFADIEPQTRLLFTTQHNMVKSFLFYPLMKEEHAEMQVADAKLAVEEAGEVEFSVKIPLQLLRVCQCELLQMYDAWKLRYNYNRKQYCCFVNDAEALNFGYDVFRVQVVRGRALKARSRASSTTTSLSAEPDMMTDRGSRSSRTSGFATGLAGGRGRFVTRIKAGKWGSAGTSSFASHYSDTADQGGDIANSIHPFVVVKFEDGVHGNQEYTVGKTNTEYDTPDPVWSTNKCAGSKCPHGKPNNKYYASSILNSRVDVSPVNGLKQFLFYRSSVPGQQLAGWVRFQVYNEHYSYMSGIENELIGEAMIPLQSVREAMAVEETTVYDDDESSEGNTSDNHVARPHQVVTSLTLVDWFDVRSSTTDEVCGQIHLRINILLANLLESTSDALLSPASEISSTSSRRYRRVADSSPPPDDSIIESKIPLNFLYPHVLNIRKHLTEVTEMIRLTEQLVKEEKTFKSSLHKKRADIQGIPTNLHVSYFRIFRYFGSQFMPNLRTDGQVAPQDSFDLEDSGERRCSYETISIQERVVGFETHATVTCGAPTAHAMGLRDCGLREMELEMHNFVAILERCNPQATEYPFEDSNRFIAEDSSEVYYPPFEDECEAEVENDVQTSVSGASCDTLSLEDPDSPTAAAIVASKPELSRKTSTYSIMARKAATVRAKAMSNKRFAKKKTARQLDRASDGKTAAYAKYPPLRTESADGVDPTTSLQYAVRILCRLEMLQAEYYMRKSVAVSQSVGSLVTCFLAELDLCLQERNVKVLDQMAKIGFLIGWESLISSHGKELYMISDAWVAIKCLDTFSFQLFEGTDMEVMVEKQDGLGGYVVKVPVPPIEFLKLPESLREGGLIGVTAVLFTQGINEMQSLANMVGHSGVSIQRKINSTSFHTISEYYSRFTDVCGTGMSEASVGSHPDEILRNLRLSVESENSASKNTCILLHAADAVRSLNGGRVTYCKSGKDRTAMSTTLEQARLLVQRKRHVLQEIESGGATEYGPLGEVKDVANIMREFGVRIHIAKKNVGRYKYSFNSLQRKLLPEIYRPPLSTIQDMVTSVTTRDS
uniref:Inositol-3,4-bisphosphate 4-phosphatase n=1 Tax=Hyaloperonospora arabidopsidis (strain Emoy2) TaxID=559515 RepID=M4BXE5_HYAAE